LVRYLSSVLKIALMVTGFLGNCPPLVVAFCLRTSRLPVPVFFFYKVLLTFGAYPAPFFFALRFFFFSFFTELLNPPSPFRPTSPKAVLGRAFSPNCLLSPGVYPESLSLSIFLSDHYCNGVVFFFFSPFLQPSSVFWCPFFLQRLLLFSVFGIPGLRVLGVIVP